MAGNRGFDRLAGLGPPPTLLVVLAGAVTHI